MYMQCKQIAKDPCRTRMASDPRAMKQLMLDFVDLDAASKNLKAQLSQNKAQMDGIKEEVARFMREKNESNLDFELAGCEVKVRCAFKQAKPKAVTPRIVMERLSGVLSSDQRSEVFEPEGPSESAPPRFSMHAVTRRKTKAA